MFIETIKVKTEHTRNSKTGVAHTYIRNKTVALFKCDSCTIEFTRELGHIDHRRLNNDYSHVCPNCNQKKFAQSKGVERRRFWNLPADSDLDISKI